MTDMEMDLIIAKAEVLNLQNTVRKQEDLIANLRRNIAALQDIIDKQRSLNMKAIDALVGGQDG